MGSTSKGGWGWVGEGGGMGEASLKEGGGATRRDHRSTKSRSLAALKRPIPLTLLPPPPQPHPTPYDQHGAGAMSPPLKATPSHIRGRDW